VEKEGTDRRVDWVGGGLFTVGITLMLFSITQGGVNPKGWRTICTSPYLGEDYKLSILLVKIFPLFLQYQSYS
jgi:hypothetical protein